MIWEGVQPPSHMTPDEFRRLGRTLVDWIADYHESLEELPIASSCRPGDIRMQLPQHPPKRGEPLERALADLEEIILPGLTHWQSPGFFAFFPANVSFPAILGDLASSGLGVQGMSWSTSPACTELEIHVLDWVAELLNLPSRFTSGGAGGGVIQDTASGGVLCALAAARQRVSAANVVAYASQEAHSSMTKGARIAGYEALRSIEVDANLSLRPDCLADAIRQDQAAGLTPAFVAATAGTTSSNAFDPVSQIAEVCRQQNLWLHVDAAMCGTAALCPEFRWVNDGLDQADSYSFNPHKWMLTNFDCSCFFTADSQSLTTALRADPEYLRDPTAPDVGQMNLRDWQIPLGRRFRALKLWFVIRSYGAEGLQAHVRHHVALSQEFAAWIERHERLDLAFPARLNLVGFRHRDGDEATGKLFERINGSGHALVSHTRVWGRFVIRASIGGTYTKARHVEILKHIINDFVD